MFDDCIACNISDVTEIDLNDAFWLISDNSLNGSNLFSCLSSWHNSETILSHSESDSGLLLPIIKISNRVPMMLIKDPWNILDDS